MSESFLKWQKFIITLFTLTFRKSMKLIQSLKYSFAKFSLFLFNFSSICIIVYVNEDISLDDSSLRSFQVFLNIFRDGYKAVCRPRIDQLHIVWSFWRIGYCQVVNCFEDGKCGLLRERLFKTENKHSEWPARKIEAGSSFDESHGWFIHSKTAMISNLVE